MSNRETIEAWAEITIKNWHDNLRKEGIGSTGQLFNSFATHVVAASDGNIALVEFTFKYYGKFVDMGVGKGIKLSEVGEVRKSRRELGKRRGNLRSPKKWYSKELYVQVTRLKEILAQKYGQQMTTEIKEIIAGELIKLK